MGSHVGWFSHWTTHVDFQQTQCSNAHVTLDHFPCVAHLLTWCSDPHGVDPHVCGDKPPSQKTRTGVTRMCFSVDLGVVGQVQYGREVVTVSDWCKCRMRIKACQLNVRVHALLTEHRQFRRLTQLQQSILHLYVLSISLQTMQVRHTIFSWLKKNICYTTERSFFFSSRAGWPCGESCECCSLCSNNTPRINSG